MTTYRIKAHDVTAFQWWPDRENPIWFNRMIEKGKARETKNGVKSFVVVESGKRGPLKGLAGDWVVKDEYDHTSIRSKRTFEDIASEI